VFIKVKKPATIEDIMTLTQGEVKCEHNTLEISTVTISQTGIGRRTISIANLPHEMPAESIRNLMTKYGTVLWRVNENICPKPRKSATT
jgi:hypothetical protein